MAPSERPGSVVLVKLGGSLITEKAQRHEARRDVLSRLAGELATGLRALEARGAGLVLGHGSGSFGHVAAREVGYRRAATSRRAMSSALHVHRAARRLHDLVLEALEGAGVAAWSLAPSSLLVARSGAPERAGHARISALLKAAFEVGTVPVLYGDVVLDRDLGWTIASTETVLDEVVASLQELGRPPETMFWLGETDGVWDRDGRVLAEIDASDEERVLPLLGAPTGTDVTGGMRLRIGTACRLARRGVPSWIGNGLVSGRLARVLAGESEPGTRIGAAEATP